MAASLAWKDLNAKQRKLALDRWHKLHGTSPSPPPTSADKNPLYNPVAVLSGQQLKKATNDIVGAQYRPQFAALDRQSANATTQGTALANRVSGYSGQVDKRTAVAQAQQQAIAERLGQALDSVNSQANQRADQLDEAERARLASDRMSGGTGGPAADAVANELAALRARSSADTQAAQTQGATQSANYGGLLAATRGAEQLHGQEQQTQLANRLANDLAEVRAKRTDLAGTVGGAKAKTLLDLRQQQFNNQAVKAEYGLKQSQLLADVKKTNAQIALQRQQQSQTAANNSFNQQNATADNARQDQSLADSEARDSYQREHNLGPYKPPASKTPAQESADARRLKTGVENLAVDYKQLLDSKDAKGRRRSPQRVEEILRKRGAPPIVILAGADLAQFGYVRPEHIRSLKIAGVQIPSAWRAPRGAATYGGKT